MCSAEKQAKVQAFVERLSQEERMLIVLRRGLYEDQPEHAVEDERAEEKRCRRESGWQAMLNDLRNRLEGNPYIFKLANRIQDDIERIQMLQGFERELDVDLADYVISPEAKSEDETKAGE